jgi:broad specificity phosphatase PhoE
MSILIPTNSFNLFPPIPALTDYKAQAWHKPTNRSLTRHLNILPPDPDTLQDPKLTPYGEAQCDNFRKDFRDDAQYITHILSSPLSRCLDTASLALKDVLAKPIKIAPMAELQSFGGGPNGTGLSVLDLKQKYGSPEGTTQCDLEGSQIAERKPQFDWSSRQWYVVPWFFVYFQFELTDL